MKPRLATYFLPALLCITLLAGVLRFYQLESNPPGLYIDEVSIGKNAYSLLTTGKDEHGVFLPLWFEAFGEYKLPVYIYLTAGVMAILGKSDFAVRFAAAFFGTTTAFLLAYFLKEVFRFSKEKVNTVNFHAVPLLASFLLAVSPWHIHFSRGGFEITVSVFFYICGVYALLLFLRTKRVGFFLLGTFLWIITLYTYNAFRIITPISFLVLFFAFYKLRISKATLLTVFSGVALLAFPYIMFSFSPDGNSRFAQTTFSADYEVKTVSEKVFVYPQAFLKNYISYFSFDYLFNVGDQNGRHQVPGMGLFYRWQLPFLILGVFALIRKEKKMLVCFLAFLLVIAPLPGAFVRPSPHSLRNLLSVVPFVTLIAFGIIYLIQKQQKYVTYLVVFVLIGISAFETSYYLHHYYTHYSRVNLADWGGGYKTLAQKTAVLAPEYDAIVVDRNLPDTQLYLSFYEPALHITEYVGTEWKKPEGWEKRKVLYIRPYYGATNNKVIDTVYLPNLNNDIFAELWEL